MPLLDVNDAFDASMLDTVTVIRRVSVVDSHGRVATTSSSLSISAVVTMASPDDIARLPEEEYTNKAITVYTTARLQGASRDEAGVETLPDQVLWHGSVYVVRALDDYSGYGRGFVNAVATLIDPVGPPPMPAPLGNA